MSIDPSSITRHLSNASGPAKLPTPEGNFLIRAWRVDGQEHVALTLGDVASEDILVRVHSECLTGDVFGSLRCDCGQQLHQAMRQIAVEGRGVIIYMKGHEGRGIGIVNKIAAYQLQEEGLDTFAANRALGFGDDERTYDAAAYILNELGVRSIRLLSNNPDKLFSLRTLGITVNETISLVTERNEYNERYLDAKANNGHLALRKKYKE
ncbi:MAG TPA: GTP cyclohydrolase II [Candidatus Saccharimonadales bacterium]|nr:GTP cyclohydrolase II [Candidatus Saccharimonadales bacterium]